jgi:hypothetical protein
MKYFLWLALASHTLAGADATGTWVGEITLADGGRVAVRIVLTQDGTTVSGTAGPDAIEQHPIQNGQAKSRGVTFQVDTGDSISVFVLEDEGDSMSGIVASKRDGRTQKARLVVNRAK